MIEITQDIQTICQELLDRYLKNIELTGHNASGELVNTATYNVKWDGRYFTVIFNLQDYWKYIENGTKPHFPPIEEIEKWIRVKNIVPETRNGKVPTTKQLAYIISHNISENGTKPTYLLKNTIATSQDLVKQLKEAVLNQIKKELKNQYELSK